VTFKSFFSPERLQLIQNLTRTNSVDVISKQLLCTDLGTVPLNAANYRLVIQGYNFLRKEVNLSFKLFPSRDVIFGFNAKYICTFWVLKKASIIILS